MFNVNEIINIPPFSLDRNEKKNLFTQAMFDLSKFHYANCIEYKKICDVLDEKTPFLSVRLFKDYDLLSIPRSEVFKTLTSSGTSGQAVSKIYLDRLTSINQTKVLTKITSDFIGNKRLPMLVIDSKTVLKDRNIFSARGAGILGFSMLGRNTTYALDENMQLDIEGIEQFLDHHKDEDIFLFGFTFMIWEYFYNALKRAGRKLHLERGILLHGGGFKKLSDQAVDNDTFKRNLNEICGLTRVYNYYGMVEQTGSIFIECEHGRLHASIFSDVIIRRYKDFSVANIGEQGLIQLLSLLPQSYPGHSILSEDIGEIIGEDDCPCGRLGKTFKIHGRIKSAEVRGCSDSYEKR